MKRNVLVSVVLPVYNAEKFICAAINSVLEQTYSSFELIIINDGSQDDSLKKINEFNDPRIVVINQANKGLIASLNYGISLAKGMYIARMDADDILLPLRFEKQVEYLEANLDYGVVGTSGVFIQDDIIVGDFEKPISDIDIKCSLFIDSPMIHPSVMIRKDLMPIYDSEFYQVEDYALWVKLSKQTKFYNLPDKLIKYRLLETSETRKSQGDNLRRHQALKSIYSLLFQLDGYNLSDGEIDQYTYSMYRSNFDLVNPMILKGVYRKILTNKSFRLKMLLSERWFGTLVLSKHTLKEFWLYLFTSYTYTGLLFFLYKKMKHVFN